MKSDLPPARPPATCPSCGNSTSGKFCAHCGEQKPGTEDRSLRHYLDEVLDFFTPVNSKVLRSLACLVAKPGFLSTENLRGSRVRYAKPLSLFIAINVVYYFSIALAGVNTFSTPLATQLHQNDYYPALAKGLAESRAKAKQMSPAAFEKAYDGKAATLSKTLVFLFIPIYGLIFQCLFFRKRRHYAENLVVATHLWSFILLLLTIAVPVMAGGLMLASGIRDIPGAITAHDNLFSTILQSAIGIYMALMMRRVYHVNFWLCVALATGISWSFFHIVWLYRFLLFLITLVSM